MNFSKHQGYVTQGSGILVGGFPTSVLQDWVYKNITRNILPIMFLCSTYWERMEDELVVLISSFLML